MKFGKDKKLILKAMEEALDDVADQILERARDLLEIQGVFDEGTLSKSGDVVKEGKLSRRIQFTAAHAPYIEFGRGPNLGMPPLEPIKEWLRRKSIQPTAINPRTNKLKYKNQDQLAWAIAKYIQKHGQDPKPFLRPAYDEISPKLKQTIDANVRKVISA